MNVRVTGLLPYGGFVRVKLFRTKYPGEDAVPVPVKLPISRVPSVVGFCEGCVPWL